MLDREGVYGLATAQGVEEQEVPTKWADSDIARSISGSWHRSKERWRNRLTRISSRFARDSEPDKRVVYLNDGSKNAHYAKNYVSTTKFSVLSFFPMFLYLQFSRPANFYFLVVGILQVIDLFSLVDGFGRYGVILTLGIMLTISGIREAYDDIQRYRQDRKVNRAQTHIVGQPGKARWGNVRVGEILKVHKREFIPADLLLLSCSSLDGVVFVETKNLDGETNLKRKACLAPLAPYCGTEEDLLKLKGKLECEPPNDRIYQFVGTLFLDAEATAAGQGEGNKDSTKKEDLRLAITPDNLLVRGSSLRNAEFCYGLVVYAGDDTKLMQNMRDPPKKLSTLERRANRWLIVPWCWQLFCTSLFSGLGASACGEKQPWYLDGESASGECTSLDKFALFIRYWILFAAFVPIGLYVTMELVRLCQTIFIQMDWKMYYKPLDVWTNVRTTGLNEELGVIDYIFSDKTGTLTANEMEFKKCFVDGVVFSTEADRDREVYRGDCEVYSTALMRDAMQAEQVSGYNHKNAASRDILARKNSTTSSQSSRSSATGANATDLSSDGRPSRASAQAALLFFHLLGLCHTVVPESSIQREEDVRRKALSPRETLEKVGAALSPRKRSSSAAAAENFDLLKVSQDDAQQDLEVPTQDENSSGKEALSSLDPSANGAAGNAVNGTVREGTVKDEKGSDSSGSDGQVPVYQSTSPDESALVLAAYHAGLEFVSRSSSAMVLKTFGIREEWEVLGVIEFTSARKRMSVILREKIQGETGSSGSMSPLRVYTKGADNVIFERLEPGQEGEVQKMAMILDSFAAEGLRTLVMGYAEIDEEFFADWLDQYTTAQGLLGKEREDAMSRVEDLLERNLVLLGASAIEDKLQEHVPDSLRKFARAGIKTWVATGDKQETAINIGLSCGILDQDMDVVVINETSLEDTEAQLDRTLGRWTALRHLQGSGTTGDSQSAGNGNGGLGKDKKMIFGLGRKSSWTYKSALELVRIARVISSAFEIFPGCCSMRGANSKNSEKDSLEVAIEERSESLRKSAETHITSFGLVVDGYTLQYVLDSQLSEKFMVLGKMARAVITCRVSPKQKADLVRLVRKYDPQKVSLAIGDGANDVGMIQAAHVGVGLYGKEGVEAVLASDFAIGRFHFLTRLILVHGRWCFKRMSKMSMAVIYKSIFWAMEDFWMGWYQRFSSQPLVDPLLAGLYNVLLSFLPPFMLGVWDYDVPQEYALMFPEIYRKGQFQTASRYGVFVSWFLAAIWHSALVFFSIRATFALPASGSMNQGLDTGLYAMGFAIVGAVIFVQHCYFALFVGAWTWFFAALWLFSMTAYFYAGIIFCLPSVSAAISPAADGIAQFLWQQPKLYLVWFIVPVIACLPYFTYRYLKKNYSPSLKHYVNELNRRNIKLEDILPAEEPGRELAKTEKPKKPNITRRGKDFAYSGYNFEADDTGAMLRVAFRPDYRRIQMRHLKRSGSDTELDVLGVKSKGTMTTDTKHRRARSDAAALRNARFGGGHDPDEVVTDAQIKAAIMAVEAGYKPSLVGSSQSGGEVTGGSQRTSAPDSGASVTLVGGLKDPGRRRRAPPSGPRTVQFGDSAEAP